MVSQVKIPEATQTTAHSKAVQLRQLLASPGLEFIMEAHNGVSARIVERTGFKGIWASGLALSTQFGVRDSNEASWTQVVDMLEFMSDVTTIPILLDGDTGYGNFNNMRRLVKKLEQRGIAGVAIEDKQFPKTNSFIDGERQPLAEIDEFCGKIKAGKDSQEDINFSIIARVEALIAGWGMAEALKRAEAYHAAGADAILIHSKLARADEILEFTREWANRCPVVIVPTKYYSTPTEVFRRADISLVIWANHMIRAAVEAMENISSSIYQSESLIDAEDRIASVSHLFELQGADELSRAQQRYLKPRHGETKAIVLAASRGSALRELTHDRPKVMLPVGGKPLLRRLLDEFKRQGIHQTLVVAGYKADAINVSGIQIRLNENHEHTGELVSLACARDDLTGSVLISYGDLLFRSYILRDLLDRDGEIVVVVDSQVDADYISGSTDYAYCSRADDRGIFSDDVYLKHIAETADSQYGEPSGRWIGMLQVRGAGMDWLHDAMNTLAGQTGFEKFGLPDLLNHLIDQGHPIHVHYINGHWLDVNTLEDIDRASDFTHGQITT
ncbi:MAG: phosphoenolpyruvate mutase [Gammaproteobacteria bacterium]